jgi:protein required for attachment to host cells
MHSGSSGHHALAPRHDPKALAKEKFADAIAQQLDAGATGAFDELVVVAPPRVLSKILEALNPATDAKVIGTLAKDLVKVPDDELCTHLRPWARPVHDTCSETAPAVDLHQ